MMVCEPNEHNFALIGNNEETCPPLNVYMFCNKCGKVREVIIPEDAGDDWDVNETADK